MTTGSNGAYKLTYSATLSWIGAGQGPAGSPQSIPGSGNAQTLTLFNKVGGQVLVGTGGTPDTLSIGTSDLTTLTNNMAADILAQFEASPTLGQIQAWPSGTG